MMLGSRDDTVGTYLGARCNINEIDGIGNHADSSSRHRDVPSVKNDVNTTENKPENVRTCREMAEPPIAY